MATLTDGKHTAGFIVSEANGYRSRATGTVTVPSGGYAAGTILGQITTGGKFVRHDSDADDGSETEAAILYQNLTESGDTDATLIIRDCEVNGSDLTYEDGADATAKTASNSALADLGIIVR